MKYPDMKAWLDGFRAHPIVAASALILLLAAILTVTYLQEVVKDAVDPKKPTKTGIPIAFDDTLRVVNGESTVIDVLENDRDPDGDELTITRVTAPQYGRVELVGEGNIQYSSSAEADGDLDSFEYLVSDGTHTVKGRVTIQMTPVPHRTEAKWTRVDSAGRPYQQDFHFNGPNRHNKSSQTIHRNERLRDVDCQKTRIWDVDYECESGPCGWTYAPNNHRPKGEYGASFRLGTDGCSFTWGRKFDSGATVIRHTARYEVLRDVCAPSCEAREPHIH